MFRNLKFLLTLGYTQHRRLIQFVCTSFFQGRCNTHVAELQRHSFAAVSQYYVWIPLCSRALQQQFLPMEKLAKTLLSSFTSHTHFTTVLWKTRTLSQFYALFSILSVLLIHRNTFWILFLMNEVYSVSEFRYSYISMLSLFVFFVCKKNYQKEKEIQKESLEWKPSNIIRMLSLLFT